MVFNFFLSQVVFKIQMDLLTASQIFVIKLQDVSQME